MSVRKVRVGDIGIAHRFDGAPEAFNALLRAGLDGFAAAREETA